MFVNKVIYLLLTWPIGIYVISSVVLGGFQLEPYALAVHEMMGILVFLLLMISSLLFVFRVESNGWSTAGKIWHILKLVFAAAFMWLVLISSYFHVELESIKTLAYIATLVLLLVVGFGVFSTLRMERNELD